MSLSFIKERLKNKYIRAGIIVLLIIVGFVFGNSHNKIAPFEYSKASIGTVTETVNVTGTIFPVGKATLAFGKSGIVSWVNVHVGDHVQRGQVIASIDPGSDRAARDSAEATLADNSRSLTVEELAVQKTSLANAETGAQNASHNGFVKAQGALFNYADTFFTNSQSANPSINVSTPSQESSIAINNERLIITDTMKVWGSELAMNPAPSGDVLITNTKSHLTTIKKFLNDLSLIVNALSAGSSGLSQSTINTYVTLINSGLTALDTAIDTAASAHGALLTAKSNYNLRLAGNSAESIAALSAKVAEAQATLSEDTITSPIDGIITRADPTVGEFVSAGQQVFGVQSNGEFKIEAFVPEADIAKISLNNLGSTTLDAYGSLTFFDVRVASINPAPTVTEGVPTYKVTLFFSKADDRIRSGMTANLLIFTHRKENVLLIPYRAVAITATSTTVRLVNPDGKTFTMKPVAVGLKGSEGTIEITSGLKEGDSVVTYIKN